MQVLCFCIENEYSDERRRVVMKAQGSERRARRSEAMLYEHNSSFSMTSDDFSRHLASLRAA